MTPSEVPKFVVPGEYIGAAEEFVPGPGTYEHGGRIFSSLVGIPTIDPSDRTVRVAGTNSVPTLSEGDVVYARVDELKSAMAICTILSTTESRRGFPGEPEGTVHISKVKDGYTESLTTELAVGDILVAKVLQAHPSIKLTTAPSTLGVISARCQVCHGLMVIGDKGLNCPRCGNREQRKLAQGPRPSVLPS
ncbi:MAG: exosome complex RNA-binding protein Csl4 [Thermoplasmata archaeon]|nr:exosome complex RNA-binding protein Csl4 [Thermoplasmata archaeon]